MSADIPGERVSRLQLPRLYAIVDLDCLTRTPLSAASPAEAEGELFARVVDFASELYAGGVRLLQYRAKQLPARMALAQARALRERFAVASGDLRNGVTLVMNDRADLCLAAGFDGVHVGQDDLAPEAVRGLIGRRILGVSTHNPEQVHLGDAGAADYVAIGPVFATGSKLNPDPVVGLEGVRRARQLTAKPLVAIGGITLENCRQVLEAGADSVAIISGLLERPRESAERFLRALA